MSENIRKAIPSYVEIRAERQQEYETMEKEKRKTIFVCALDYYNLNYPKSEINRDWTKKKVELPINIDNDIEKEFEKLTEDQLYIIFDIFDYYRVEVKFKDVRNFERFQYLLNEIKKMLPGGKYIEELRKIKERMSEDQYQMKILTEQIEKERKEFNKRLEKKGNSKIEKDDPKTELFRCTVCKKVCKTKGGLTSHMRIHE